MPHEFGRQDHCDPRWWSPGYRAVVFDPEGTGTCVIRIDADDDDEALRRARAATGTRAFELWDALSRLGRYEATT